MSARRTHSTREQWRDEDYDRRSKKAAISSRDYHNPSPSYGRRQTASELEVKAARRELNGTGSSRQSTYHHYEGRTGQGRGSHAYASSISPHRGSRAPKRSQPEAEVGEERASYKNRPRKDASGYIKRRRSRSASPSKGRLRKQPRTHSRSPHRSESLTHGRHGRPRRRSVSPEREPNRQRHRSKRRKHADSAIHHPSDLSPSPSRGRRARSPLSRQEFAGHRPRGRSPSERRPETPRDEYASHHHSYSRSHRDSRRSSPPAAEKEWGGDDGRVRAEARLPRPTEGGRRSSWKYRHPESPVDPHPRAAATTSHSRRESVEASRNARGSERARFTSSSPSRQASAKRYHKSPRTSPRDRSPSASVRRRSDGTMPDAFGRPLQSRYSEGPSTFRQAEGSPPSPPRPIPSFTAADERAPMDNDMHLREAFPMHGMKASEIHGPSRGMTRPSIDTRRTYSPSPQYLTPTSTHHVSPQAVSPYSNGRGWGQQQSTYHGQPP